MRKEVFCHFFFKFSPAQKITTVQSTLRFGNSELIPGHKPAKRQLSNLHPVLFLLFCWGLVRLRRKQQLPGATAPVKAHPSIRTVQFAAVTPSKTCVGATKSPPLCCLITINIGCRRGGGDLTGGVRALVKARGGKQPRKILPHLSDKKTSRKWKPQNKQAQETLVPAYTFLMCQKKRAITGDEEGEEKNPYRLYFFHLNCKHLFGCKANRTFISLLRFGLIMSTPTFGGVGRCWGATALLCAVGPSELKQARKYWSHLQRRQGASWHNWVCS